MPPDARTARLEQDLRRLRDLAARSGGRIEILRVAGSPPQEVVLELRFQTASSERYPAETQPMARVSIQLSGRYPLDAPVAVIQTPIFHPNVYIGGRICFGVVWQPSENLELLAQRIIRILTFDEASMDIDHPANPAAALWYRTARRRHPSAFPSDRWAPPPAGTARPGIGWRSLDPDRPPAGADWRQFSCPRPGCGATLRVPAGTSRARCGRCREIVTVPR